MQRHFRASAVALCAVVFIAGNMSLSGCAKKAPPKRGAPPVAVDVAPATRQDIATFLSLDGQIAPLQESNLSLTQSGTLIGVYVTEGQHVGKGELLAKIDDSTLRAQLAAQQALVASSRARLGGSTLTNPITRQQTQTTVINAQQQLAQAKNNLVAAQAVLDNAKIVFNGNKSLYSQGYVSQTVLEQSRSQFVAAEQTLANDRDLVRSAEAQVRNAQQGTAQTGVQGQQIAADSASVDQARAVLQQVTTQIAQTALYAPYDGVITQRFLDPGAQAGPNQTIVRISQIDTVYVNANVPDEQLAFVHTGTPVRFTTASLPGKTFTGRIDDVNATPTQGTLSYRARVREPNPGNLLRGGMLVSISVRKEYHAGALVVPRTAIFQTETGSSVFGVIDAAGPDGAPQKKAKQIPVQLGIQTDLLTEVRASPLHPGSLVITTRPDALQDGSVVAAGGPSPGGGLPGRRAHGAGGSNGGAAGGSGGGGGASGGGAGGGGGSAGGGGGSAGGGGKAGGGGNAGGGGASGAGGGAGGPGAAGGAASSAGVAPSAGSAASPAGAGGASSSPGAMSSGAASSSSPSSSASGNGSSK